MRSCIERVKADPETRQSSRTGASARSWTANARALQVADSVVRPAGVEPATLGLEVRPGRGDQGRWKTMMRD
jgi:hypothetical protein